MLTNQLNLSSTDKHLIMILCSECHGQCQWPFTALSPQHTEDTSEIQELTKYKPHVLLTQENTQIKELQQENKGKNRPILFCGLHGWSFIFLLTLFMTVSSELWLSLEEHQYALELIMGRYRKQMLQLMMAKKELDTKPVLSLHEDHAKVHWLSAFAQSLIG